jgi:hypothetical protein
MEGGVDSKEIDAAGLLLLRAFGVDESEARRISHLPRIALPEIPLREAVINNFASVKPR